MKSGTIRKLFNALNTSLSAKSEARDQYICDANVVSAQDVCVQTVTNHQGAARFELFQFDKRNVKDVGKRTAIINR